jgi:peptidoglycan-associated lipoprotein
MKHLLVTLIVAVSCLGCASKATAPPVAANEPPKPTSAPAPESTSEVLLHIDESIRSACGVSESKTFFAFDSAVVMHADLQLMSKLSSCFNGGPLDGRSMDIDGYADPRGEADYNFELGEQRAESVKTLLTTAGMSDDRIHVASHGESEATGFDESTWAKDRRVDLSLASLSD